MPEIQTKRFLWIAFHRFPLTIDKITWSLTIFIDFDFYLLASPGSNYTLNWGYIREFPLPGLTRFNGKRQELNTHMFNLLQRHLLFLQIFLSNFIYTPVLYIPSLRIWGYIPPFRHSTIPWFHSYIVQCCFGGILSSAPALTLSEYLGPGSFYGWASPCKVVRALTRALTLKTYS